jgi:hypothetical protein
MDPKWSSAAIMRNGPGAAAVAMAFLTLFLGGAAVGLWLADALAPGSWLANIVSFFALPLAFAISLQAWYGLALLTLISRLLLRRPNRLARPSAPAHTGLDGSWLFVPIGSAFGALAGLVSGLASPTQSLWLVAAVYWLVGTLYGVTGWRLARRGYLFPPETT